VTCWGGGGPKAQVPLGGWNSSEVDKITATLERPEELLHENFQADIRKGL